MLQNKPKKLNKKPSCVEQIVEVISTIVDDSNKIWVSRFEWIFYDSIELMHKYWWM